jgi:hypothetical protein
MKKLEKNYEYLSLMSNDIIFCRKGRILKFPNISCISENILPTSDGQYLQYFAADDDHGFPTPFLLTIHDHLRILLDATYLNNLRIKPPIEKKKTRIIHSSDHKVL